MALTAIFILLAAMLILRMPIAFAMGIAGLLGLSIELGPTQALSLLERQLYEQTSAFILVSIPLFILMAELLTSGDMTRRAVIACQAWLGHMRGGLALATVWASVLLAALVGSSTASSATMASSAYPEMKKHDYDDRLSTAVVSVGGTLAILIPPSIILIVYGVMTETSIGKLFLAGVVPGFMTAAALAITVMIVARREGMAPMATPFDLKLALRESAYVWPTALLLIVVITAIYTGFASPTEAGAVGAAGALRISILLGTATPRPVATGLSRAIQTTVMIVAIIYCSQLFSSYLVFTKVTQNVIHWIEGSGMPAPAIICAILLILLVLGCFLDQLAILSLTLPLTFPIIAALKYDPVWFGIIITKTVEIGLLTPPLGLNVYVTSSQTKVPLKRVFEGVIPFLIAEVIVTAILVLFPSLTLWLPSKM